VTISSNSEGVIERSSASVSSKYRAAVFPPVHFNIVKLLHYMACPWHAHGNDVIFPVSESRRNIELNVTDIRY
jgi:hypothetical protein